MRFSRNRFLVRVILIAGFCGGLSGGPAAQELSWDHPAEGLAVSLWEPASRCEEQVPALFVVKIDPDRFRFAIYHYRDEGFAAPVTIQEWHRYTGATVLFNAGLFREDYSYLGLLFKEGRSVGSKRHALWHGLFVAEPAEPGFRKARVLDLTIEPFSEERPAYREVAQSLMLLDRSGQPRVRRTDKRAHQTVVGEDEDGAILLIKTADTVGLWTLADCLHRGFPALRHAMAMDGGASSDLLIDGELLDRHRKSGTLPPWHPLVDGKGLSHIALPAVIGILPRDGGSAHPKDGDAATAGARR